MDDSIQANEAHAQPANPLTISCFCPLMPYSESSDRRVAIVQPCYIPWKGYFDIIAHSDEFIIFDDVQYVERTWYNRNRLKTQYGTKWLSIPLKVAGRRLQSIAETEIAEPWAEKHLNFVKSNYRSAPFFSDHSAVLQALYEQADRLQTLLAVDRLFIEFACKTLGIKTPLLIASDLGATGKATQRLLDLCLKRRATSYLSGPAAKSYLVEKEFEDAGVAVEWMDYAGYPEYPQLHGTFDHAVSVIDLLLSTGPQAAHFMKYTDGGIA